jgi:hypothetical protein
MKYFLIFIISITISSLAFSQEKSESALLVDGKLYLDSLYSSKDELILFSGIHRFDNLSTSDIKNKIKNWASLSFVNLKEVLVSESEDQLVLNYINTSFYTKSLGIKSTIDWYIRLLIQFKDGRVRFTYFDDGNVRMPSSQYSAGVQARTIRLKDYFPEKNGTNVCGKAYTQGMLDLVNSIKENFKSVIIKNEATQKSTDNW